MDVRNLQSKLLPILLLSGFLLGQTDSGFSQARHKGHRGAFGGKHGGFGKIERLASELNLTDVQVATLKDQRTASQKDAIRLRADLEVARVELHELIDAAKPSENQVRQHVEKMGDFRTALMLNRVLGRLKMREVLTEEQFQKLKEMRNDAGKRRGKRGRHHGRGMGFEGGDSPDFDIDED